MKNYSNRGVQARGKKTYHLVIRNLGLAFLLCSCLLVLFLIIDLALNYDRDTQRQLGQISFESEEFADGDWSLILVNRSNSIPKNYEVNLFKLENGEEVDERIHKPLQNMLDSAIADKVYPVVVSGYRTTKKQQAIMNDKIGDYKAQGCSESEAVTLAEKWVAIPGTSEHQLGLSVDINADGVNSTGDEVYSWLDKNSYKFGFIRRYPPDKTEITGVINEPWHYRYVGVSAAKEIYRQGLCLEEYLEQ